MLPRLSQSEFGTTGASSGTDEALPLPFSGVNSMDGEAGLCADCMHDVFAIYSCRCTDDTRWR